MSASTVLLRRGALGDVVLLGAVTGQLAGRVVVATDPRWASVAARLQGVDAVVPWPRHPGDLPAGRWVDLQGSLRSRRWPCAARIHKRSLRRRARLWFGLGPGRPTVPELYAEALGLRPLAAPWIALPPGIPEALVLIPGAAWGPKRWPEAHFVRVGRAWPGLVVVVGGPDDSGVVGRITGSVPGAQGLAERGFEGTLQLLAGAAAAVGGDTGLLHLAGACGVPVVALFGPTHPQDGFAVHPGAVLQREGLRCRPCSLHRVARCARGDQACMAIEPQRVLAQLQALTGVPCAGC